MGNRFGIREVCDVTLTPKNGEGNPIIITSAKMSSLETSSTTVYAQGGRGNSRLMAWEGEKTVTFTVEDALMTREHFAALAGETEFTNNKLTVTVNSFAKEYEIEATGFVRYEGSDSDTAMTIRIPRAKMQSNLNLSMSPTGDPMSFTFTFDAFPENEVLYEIELVEEGSTDDDKIKVTLNYATAVLDPYFNTEKVVEKFTIQTTDSVIISRGSSGPGS